MKIERETDSNTTEQLKIFNQYRPKLQAMAYRMLGTVTDAEDLVQETFIKWRKVDVWDLKNPQAYLMTIITRLCLDYLRSARVKREQYVGTWLPQPIVSYKNEPIENAELADSLSMAFLVVLEKLSPIERAVFLLREVFEYDYEAIATIANKTTANCRQIARRAKLQLKNHNSRFTPSDEQQQQLTEKFIQACDRGNLSELIALLSADITLYSDGGGKVKALLQPIQGNMKVARFLIALRRSKLIPNYDARLVQVNGQAGILYSLSGVVQTIVALETNNRTIQSIYFVRNPDKLSHLLGTEVNNFKLQ